MYETLQDLEFIVYSPMRELIESNRQAIARYQIIDKVDKSSNKRPKAPTHVAPTRSLYPNSTL